MYADAEQKKKKRRNGSRDLKSRLSGKNVRRAGWGGSIQERLSHIRRSTSAGNGRLDKRIDLRSRLSARKKPSAMPIELDHDRYYSLIASEEDQ